MESTISPLSLGTTSVTPIEAAKVRLDAAVKKFEESYSALVAPKGKSSPIPNITLQQIASTYEVTATYSDISQRENNFGQAVEQLLLASVQEDTLPKTEFRKKAQAAKDSFSKSARKVGEFVGKLLPLAIFACGVTSTLGDASLVAFPLKSVANGTALVLQLCQKEKDRGEEFISELDRISYQSRRVFEIQKQPRESQNPLLLEKSLDLMAEVINFLATSMQYLKHGFFMKVAKSLVLGPEVWQASIKNLHLAYEEYDQALLLQIAYSINNQQTQTREASLALKDDVFFEWLAPSVCEVEAQLLANRMQRADGTLGWVLELEEFRRWRVGNLENAGLTPAQTLWLTGLPGTGKSTIAAYVYDLLLHQYPDATILHFFCKSGTPGLTTTHNIVRTLCYQLTQKDAFYQRYLEDKPVLPSSGRCENVLLLFNTLIKVPLSNGPQDSDIFILLDGLDELEDTSAQAGQPSYTSKTEIETLLEALVQISKAKIFVTSRSSVELKRILDGAGTTRAISWRDNTDDIKRYVKARVDKSPKLTSRFQQIGKDPLEFFEKASGIFLWAALVLDMLERTVSTNAFSVALEQVPPTMTNVYDQIIERTVRSGNYRWIKEILGWTLILPSPFAVQQMSTAVNLSLNDEIYNMEDFLRSECGSLLDLVPVLGSSQDFEIHLGHETFQAYLTNPTCSHGDLFTPNIAHGKAALACLRYLIAEKPLSDEKFKLYATTTWRWHLRASMGIRERQFAEPLSALEDGKSLPDDLSREIIVVLYTFLTTSKVDPWLEHWFLDKRLYDKLLFKEVYHTCIELSAWYRANKQHLQDQETFETQGISTESLISWCEGLPDLQCVADHLWRRACHVWMWNSWKACQQVIAGYEQLAEIGIWINHPDVVVPNDEATQLLKEEEAIVEANAKDGALSKRSGKLFGNLNLRYANFYLISQKEAGSQRHFDAVIKAGDVDYMSGVCQANMSIALRFISSRVGFEESNEKQVLSEAMIFIQDAIDEDPENPRNYEQLGHLYDHEGKKEDALKAWKTGLALDTNGETCCGEEYYQQKVWSLTRDDFGSATPNYEEVIGVLGEALKYAPAFSSSRWYHQMADMYKKKGDLEGARRTYRAYMKSDPSWNSLWKDLAETYIDHELFEETRQFNWRAYCSALTEATTFDPSGAHSHFDSWVTKAKELKEYQYFELAIEILEHGIETTSQTKTKAAIEARANFEFALGETFCAMTRWEDAVSSLEDSFKHMTHPPKRWQYSSLSDAYTSCGRYEEALAIRNKNLENDPSSSGDRASVGEIYLLSGAPSKSLKEYKTAIRLQENFAVERKGRSGYPTAFDKYVRDWYIDLGTAYERLSRPEQALGCYKKSLPHAEDQISKDLVRHGEELTFEGDFLHRTEGRNLMKLGWLYERLDPSDRRVEEIYERAVWVFKTTVHAEDDFLEEAECKEAEEELARVRRGEPWVCPTEQVDRELRGQKRARTYRMNYGVNLKRREKKAGTKQSMMRGH